MINRYVIIESKNDSGKDIRDHLFPRTLQRVSIMMYVNQNCWTLEGFAITRPAYGMDLTLRGGKSINFIQRGLLCLHYINAD